MANIKFTNFARSKLTVGISAGATTITITGASGALFPALTAEQYFYATLENAALAREIVKVTARTGDSLTVTRAQDNTTASAWNAGDTFALRFNAAAIADTLADLSAGNYSGNLTFTGTGNRIRGDFSNATAANRVMFQTTTVNGNTYVAAQPNGTGTVAMFEVADRSGDLNNCARGNMQLLTGSEFTFRSAISGTGTYLPMTFYTGGSERFRINTTGAWGIGGANYGTAGQVLKSNGDAPPTWGSAASVQIQPISASVASNAITISASALSLDFRSTTLTSGTVTTVTGTPANLVIAATDSFGAVTAAGTQRIAILAINNAGTIELAASNLSGGVSLDETGVITTVAAATTAIQIKSTTARTSVAYRVVGFVDVPFTTAVGYGAIVKAQGTGGQALAAMSSLGYGQTWQSVTRTSGTTYYNTTGKPIVFEIFCTNSDFNITTGGVTRTGIGGAGSINVAFVIPPGNSYSYTLVTGTLIATSELR